MCKTINCDVGHTLHLASTLELLFTQCFSVSHRTQLMGGASEPLYLPIGLGESNISHQLFYRADYFASALHETAHWCIAGKQRREKIDFGYWYVPEGRDAPAQSRFLAAEVKPQAIELLFSLCADYPFKVSTDNFGGDAELQIMQFYSAVIGQAQQYRKYGLPARAKIFCAALIGHYQTTKAGLSLCDFFAPCLPVE